MVPNIIESIQGFINNILDKFDGIKGFDVESFRTNLFGEIENFGVNISTSLPSMVVGFVTSFFSTIGTLIIGFIIGFYLLISFDNFSDSIHTFLPRRLRNDFRGLGNEVNTSLRKYVQGTLVCAGVIFIGASIGFGIAGLKAYVLFGLFCGITNIIPYIGPYIGGAPAVIVGFSQGPVVGIICLISIIVVQFIESNFLNPIVMSKTMKLHPVTIILGLLIFGYFWGMIGMLFATPIIAVAKAVFMFLDDKYDLLTFN
jgi:predicted PurR-regulated permease PerM